MKKVLLILLATGFVSVGFAQTLSTDGQKKVDRRVEAMKDRLDLTADQEKKIREIITRAAIDAEVKQAEADKIREERRKEAEAKMKQVDTDIEATLTEEQKAKYQRLKEQRRDQMNDRNENMKERRMKAPKEKAN